VRRLALLVVAVVLAVSTGTAAGALGPTPRTVASSATSDVTNDAEIAPRWPNRTVAQITSGNTR